MELTCSRRVKMMACPSGFSMSVTLPTEITSKRVKMMACPSGFSMSVTLPTEITSKRVKMMACPSGFSISVTLPTEITSCEKHKPARSLGKNSYHLQHCTLKKMKNTNLMFEKAQ